MCFDPREIVGSTQPAPTAAATAAPSEDAEAIRWASLLAFLILVVPLCGIYLYEIEPDSIAYISIAREYAAGDFTDAVNAYWSPLYSWLMVPFIKTGIDPLIAAKIFGVIAGAATLWLIDISCRRMGLRAGERRVVGLMLVPLL